jgi:hypothetical protein
VHARKRLRSSARRSPWRRVLLRLELRRWYGRALDVPTRKVEKRLSFCMPRIYTDFSVPMFVGDFCDHFCALTPYACTENMA